MSWILLIEIESKSGKTKELLFENHMDVEKIVLEWIKKNKNELKNQILTKQL